MYSQTEQDTLESYFPDWIAFGAIFTAMQNMPWAEYATGTELDALYFGYHSGNKIPSSLVKTFSTNHVANSAKIATLLKTMFNKSWQHLWDVYVSSYSPLLPTSITEQETRQLEGEFSATKQGSKQSTGGDTLTLNTTTQNSGSNALQHGLTETITGDNSTTVTDNTQTATTGTNTVVQSTESLNSTYGFNTSEDSPVPDSKTETEYSSTETSSTTQNNTGTTTTAEDLSTINRRTGTDTNTITNTETRTGTETHALTDTTTDTATESNTKGEEEVISRTRTGNNGNRTYSEIIQAEFETWKYNYFENVFEDIDSVLTLCIFR